MEHGLNIVRTKNMLKVISVYVYTLLAKWQAYFLALK